jgi:tripartite-type tricarboxylate transporter receptor subunit TctC
MQTFADGYRAYVGSVNRRANPCPPPPQRQGWRVEHARFFVTTAFPAFQPGNAHVIVGRRHCEERSDEAIQPSCSALDCFASLAMTARENAKGIAMKRLVGALVALLAFTAATLAQTYPTRPITMLVGFPPGGPTDTLARILADAMQPSLGQSVVVETASGASGTIATGRVVHSSPDGYTIGIGNWTSHVGSPAIYALNYDIFTDLQPVALLAASPLWIVGKNDLPPKTAPELITWLKARPDPATFGTIGSGSAAHLCGLFFAQKTGVRLQYVPYRGGAPAMQDLIGGQIDLSCLEASQTLANVEAARFKAYAVMGEQRWPKSPSTPTMIESGVPGLSISFWHGLWTTKDTPKDVIGRLDAAVVAALANPAVRAKIEALGQVIFPADQQNPQALAAYHKAELDKWWPIIKSAGIKAGD